jgi:glycosyltransferase involved in cell wall biosynthesis
MNLVDNKKEDVTVVVCTLNNEENIGRMLNSIVHQVSQIIVADGGSQDKTVEIAEKYNVDISITKPGFSIQLKEAFKLIKHKYLFLCESDHVYPNNFSKDFIDEFERNDYFVIQATLLCKNKNNFYEKGIDLFYQIHQLDKGLRDAVGGPSIAYAKEYLENISIDNINGYSVDTKRSEHWKQKKLKQALGHTIAYHSDVLDAKTFFKKYFNYGKGDYDFYESHKAQWTTKRKLKSIFHVFNRYVIDYPIKSFKVGKPYIAIPYLWLTAIVRYSGWVYSILKNFRT